LKFRFWRRRRGGKPGPKQPPAEQALTEEQLRRVFDRARELHQEIVNVALEVVEAHGGTPLHYLVVADAVKSTVFMAFEDAWLRWMDHAIGKIRKLVAESEGEP